MENLLIICMTFTATYVNCKICIYVRSSPLNYVMLYMCLYNSIANDQPITDMKLLYKLVIPKISAHWDVVLANLEYDLAFKQELHRKYRGNPRECCTDLLEDWISSDRGISPKTFTKLLEVLCTINDVAPFMRDMIDGLKKEGIAIGM